MSASALPGIAVRTQVTSWPVERRAATASPGKFSSARKRMLSRGYDVSGYNFSDCMTSAA